jgi:hypothetical protein
VIAPWLDWPGRPEIGMPVIIAPFLDPGDASPWAAAGYAEMQAGVSSAAAWPTSGRVYYLPVAVVGPVQIQAMMWRNGATLNGNVDVGIYSRNFVRLMSSGGVVQTGINSLQFTSVPVTLMPDLYYLAMTTNTTTGLYWRWTYGATLGPLLLQSVGVRTEGGGYPLPATASPTTGTILPDYLPLLAASGRALI